MDNKDDPLGKPYHYLSTVIPVHNIQCEDDNYQQITIPIPTMFNYIAKKENISTSVNVVKVYDSNSGSESLCYAFGGYASIVDGAILLEVCSAWRDYHYDSNYITGFDSPRGGYIDVNIQCIA